MTAMTIGRCLAVLALGAMALCGAAQAAETIGAYTIVATPTAASLVSGGPFHWLNVVNAAISVNTAFTGSPMLDDGFGNAASGTDILLTFAPGTLRNGSGPDLVVFDADDNLNVYLVSTSADGFAHSISAAATTNTGVTRNYFLDGVGPTTYGVYSGTIDLSSFGIPAGQAVDQVRLFCEGPSNDPLGLGVLASQQVPVGSNWVALATLMLAVGASWLLYRRRLA